MAKRRGSSPRNGNAEAVLGRRQAHPQILGEGTLKGFVYLGEIPETC